MHETEGKKIGAVSQEDIDQLLEKDENVFEDADAPEEPSSEPTEEPIEEIDPAGDVDAVLREIPEESRESDEVDSVDDIDPSVEVDTDSVDDADEETPDRVILEGAPLEQTPKSRKRITFTWKPGKWLWMCLVTIVFIGGSFIFFYGHYTQKSKSPPRRVILTFPIVPEPMPSDTPTFIESPHTVFMKGFIVPAPLKRKDIVFVVTDIGLEFTTARAATVVKDHIPFFRSTIYEVLLNALQSMDKSKIDPINLKFSVLRGLEGVLPERSIKNVIVDTFKIFE